MRRIGVCSWSLRPASPGELGQALRRVGVDCVQLALGPLREGAWGEADTLARMREQGVQIRSGMLAMEGEDYSTLESIRRTGGVRLAELWPRNLASARASAKLAQRLGIGLVSFHAGFLPHQREHPEREMLLERVRALVDVFAAEGVGIALETGQETSATLLAVLADLERPAAGVNFDPANMLLYGMGDPVEALRELAPRVLQVHVKDARRTRTRGNWGDEVPVGDGEVDWRAFFEVLDRAGLACDLMIEREAGDSRERDIRQARERLERWTAVDAGRSR
jgi:L-ribulose-5-phosphate 3-epimerase